MTDRKRKKIPAVVYFRYGLMNLAGLVGFVVVLVLIRHFWAFPLWLFGVLVTAWLVKEAVLFPFVWRAYQPDGADATGAMIGARAVVKTRLDPTGYVQVRGELWRAERAEAGPSIEVGRLVRIRKRVGLTLYVVPDELEEN